LCCCAFCNGILSFEVPCPLAAGEMRICSDALSVVGAVRLMHVMTGLQGGRRDDAPRSSRR
jgi:hypothetical protein